MGCSKEESLDVDFTLALELIFFADEVRVLVSSLVRSIMSEKPSVAVGVRRRFLDGEGKLVFEGLCARSFESL